MSDDAADRHAGWPDWPLRLEAVAELARYVDEDRAGDLVPSGEDRPWGHDPGRGAARLERLYESLRARRIAYAFEPWNVAQQSDDGEPLYQRVRGVEETIRGPATCLDLALAFAGMCLAADLRPMIAVTAGPVPHARVLVDVERPLTGFDTVEPPGFATRRGEPGVLDGGELNASRLADGGWIVVDVVRVADGSMRRPFEGAAGRAMSEDGLYRGADWSLVDVAYERSRPGFTPYAEPPAHSRPPIHSYLPVSRSFREYASRGSVTAELLGLIEAGAADAPPVVVIKAPPGYGKSLLALRLASAADHNAGWFLAANDRKTLIASLAAAEQTERSVARVDIAGRGEKPDQFENESLAAFALARLRDSSAPWVVVLDNCDQNPRADPKTGVWNLIPVPRAAGQMLVVTTTDDTWPPIAQGHGWRVVELQPLTATDLDELRLPQGLDDEVDGRPLVAECLAELASAGAQIPVESGLDGPSLMWSLFRATTQDREAIRVARTLAWCPPEGIRATEVPGAGDACYDRCALLADAGLVAPRGSRAAREVWMHRLVSAAIRDQTWREDPDEACAVVQCLLLDDDGRGRAILLRASDEAALVRLEDAEIERVAAAVPSSSGRLWHAIGHIRERRGLVARSAEHFTNALTSLNPDAQAAEYAESLMGVARYTYQSSRDVDLLAHAGAQAAQAVRLLAPFADADRRQMGEQANALDLLIQQKIAEADQDLQRRLSRLLEIRDGLWASYEARRAINRPGTSFEPRSSPTADDRLGSERAFYNLAGINLQIAKAAHAIDRVDGQVDEAFGESVRVYDVVRSLRRQRYAGRPHPHLAACVHGLAIVTYYRALFGRPGADLITALQFVAEGLAQRSAVVVGLYGEPGAAVDDTDVGKSVELLIKVAMLADVTRIEGIGKDGRGHALSIAAEAIAEYDGAADA